MMQDYWSFHIIMFFECMFCNNCYYFRKLLLFFAELLELISLLFVRLLARDIVNLTLTGYTYSGSCAQCICTILEKLT